MLAWGSTHVGEVSVRLWRGAAYRLLNLLDTSNSVRDEALAREHLRLPLSKEGNIREGARSVCLQ